MQRKNVGAGRDGDAGNTGLRGIVLTEGDDLDGVGSGRRGGCGECAAGSDGAARPADGAGRALHSPDDCLIAGTEDGGGEALYAKRRQRDDIGENTDENVIEDCDLRGGRDRGISCDGHLHGDRICGGDGAGGDVVGLRGGTGGDALAGRRSDDAELSDCGIPAGNSVDAPDDGGSRGAVFGDGERDAMIGGERGRGGQQTETLASLNGDRGLRFFGRIGLRRDGDDDGVGLRWSGGGGVIGGVRDSASTGGLCGDHGENAAGAAAATAARKRPGKNGAGIGAGNGCERGDDGRGDAGLEAGGRGKLQREVAGDGDGGEVLFGGISDAGDGQGDAGSGGENGGRGVISVGVDGAAVVWAGGAGEAPADGGIGLAAAGNAGVEGLQRTEFDGRGNGRKRDGDVAGDGDAGDGRLGGIGVTGGSHLYFAARGKVCGGGKDSIGGDGANLRGAAGDIVDAPEDESVGGVGDGGGESERVAEQDCAGIGSDHDGYLRSWRSCGAAARAACAGGEGESKGEEKNCGRRAAMDERAPGGGALC